MKTIAVVGALVLVGAVAGVGLVFLSSTGSQGSTTQQTSQSTQLTLHGSMYVSDAGKAHGGFEYTATYDATLTESGGNGTLHLVLSTGLGDYLKKNDFSVTKFMKNSTTLTMLLDRQPIIMRFISADKIWNGTYSNYYIASSGSYAPPDELIGKISPSNFPGLTDFWYIELRLR